MTKHSEQKTSRAFIDFLSFSINHLFILAFKQSLATLKYSSKRKTDDSPTQGRGNSLNGTPRQTVIQESGHFAMPDP